jgi:hypothetical protein
MTPTTVDTAAPISPTLQDAYLLLRTDIYGRLDDAEYLAQFDFWNDEELDLVRKTIPDLATVIRGLVARHESDIAGKCKTCHTSWPCQVTETIHELMKDPDLAFGKIIEYIRESD